MSDRGAYRVRCEDCDLDVSKNTEPIARARKMAHEDVAGHAVDIEVVES